MRVKLLFFVFVSLSSVLAGFLSAQESVSKNALYDLIDEKEITTSASSWFFTASQQIALTTDQIVFLRDREMEIFSLPLQYLKTSFSNKGPYFVIQTLNPLKSLEKIDRELTLTIYSDINQESYRIIRKVYYDHSLPAVAISGADGSMVLGENDSGELWFYDGNGNLLRQVVLFPEAEYDLEKVLDVDISEDGSRVAVVAGKRGGSPAGSNAIDANAEPHLFLFSRDGQELWRKTLPELNSSEAVISPDGHLIVTNSYTISTDGKLVKRALIFNQNGSILSEVDLLFKQARFSGDSKYLLLADNQELLMLDGVTANLHWSRKIPTQSGMIADLDVTDGGEQVAVLLAVHEWDGSQFVFNQPVVTVYDNRGEAIQNITLSDEPSSKPAIHFTNQDENLIIGLGSTIFRFQKK